MTDSSQTILRARVATIILGLIGVVLSFIALQQHVVYANGLASGPSFCHINSYFNCEAVNASEWSSVLGVPVASYGLFFYLLLVGGSLCAARAGRILSLTEWSGITLLLSAFASLLSVLLFAVSEVVIGSLCLMCIGLYLVNFLTLGFVWHAAWRGRVGQGLRGGANDLFRLCGIALGLTPSIAPRAPWRVRAVALLSILVASISVILPEVVLQVYEADALATGDADVQDPITGWRKAPTIQFNLDINKGAFGDYSKGDPQAPIHIVEFADYECPACKGMSGLLHEVLERYSDKIFFVFKNYPLDQSCNPDMKHKLHEFACTAAFFSRCAGEQGKFWEANSMLFLREADRGELAEGRLIQEGAKELGIDEVAVRECMASGRYRKRIAQDIQAGSDALLQGTPSVWVNGKFVAQPSLEVFEEIFSIILEEKGGSTR